VITVAEDAKGREGVESWIAAASPRHPSLLDPHHLVAGLYNTRNVPAVFWIDERGRIVRGNDPIYATRLNRETNERTTNERYMDGVRDWVRNGAASRYVTPDEETLRRMGQSDEANDQAMAHFRLGVYLHEQGRLQDSVAQFKHAHALKPDNWNYKRQAWNLQDIEKDYGTTRQAEFQDSGIPMYPPLELPDPA
jgi:hypothetical protein